MGIRTTAAKTIRKQIQTLRQHAPWPVMVGEWSLLFLGLLLAIWATTQRREAPQLILLLLLYIITINFSLPPSLGLVGLTPVVAVASLAVLGLETAVLLALISHMVAELARPLWQPMWDHVQVKRPSWLRRTGSASAYLLSLLISGLVYERLGGTLPFNDGVLDNIAALAGLAVAYGVTFTALALVLWVIARRSLSRFVYDQALPVLTAGLLVQPFAIFGGIIFHQVGLPGFVLFAGALVGIGIVLWISWQRRFILEQQLAQIAALNSSGSSLRETLELPLVLQRTYERVAELTPLDRFDIHLRDDDGQWQRYAVSHDQAERDVVARQLLVTDYTPDDFVRWVANRGKLLDVDRRNLHFARRHGLMPPRPRPTVWLGLPLTANEQTIGVMVLQRYDNGRSYSRWSREVLLAIAGQASAAIENARLYNRTDEALARRVEQLQALLNTVQEGVLMIGVDGRILLVNPMGAELLGHRDGDWRGRSLANIATAQIGYTPDELEDLLTRLATDDVPAENRLVYQATEGGNGRSAVDSRHIERSEAPVVAQNGQVMGWLMVFRDVTEERELAQQRSDLTRMIVHDLRNPLTTFLSTLDAMQNQIEVANNATDARHLLADARRGCYDMLDMVDSLMDVNRMETGESMVDAEAMRLPPLVEQVLERLRPLTHQRQINLSYTCKPDLPAVWADREIIRRVLVNLLDNAHKFTPAGGHITVKLYLDSDPISGYEPGVRCTISDSGPGIPAEFQERIFDRYIRTNRGGAQVQGAGLGLTFCKMAVEAHNGRIWADNAPTGGGQFTFTLPGIPMFE